MPTRHHVRAVRWQHHHGLNSIEGSPPVAAVGGQEDPEDVLDWSPTRIQPRAIAKPDSDDSSSSTSAAARRFARARALASSRVPKKY